MQERHNVPLAPLTTLRLGGRARRLLTAYDEAALLGALRAEDGPVLVLGGGSNVVLPDAGIDHLVVRIALHGLAAQPVGDRVLLTAGAGEDWDALVAHAVAEGLAGIEALSGIPGSVGASPVQNIGAYGQEVAQTVTSVRAYDRVADAVVELSDCGFSYRQSLFKAEPDRWVVLAVTFALEPGALSAPVGYAELARALGIAVGDRAPLQAVRDAVLSLRKGKGMVIDPTDPDTRSVGSFFTNPRLSPEQLAAVQTLVDAPVPSWPESDGSVKVSAAWLIERSGFAKGAFNGPVGISGKHPLALVHRGGGTSAALLAVARTVRDGVREAFGVELVNEPVIVGDRL
ncbi:MAG: UDP-N-acetylmuramate dehydrogenase [Frankiales bacterium]|nr:UDP-N-acetylmuramate dehydrogenase [Frankiales bacterium]